MSKRLRITFNGICTLSPGPRRPGEDKPQRAHVLMPANNDKRKENQFKEPIPPHTPFIYVPVAALAEPVPKPVAQVTDEKLGLCNIYFIRHVRVRFEPETLQELEYFIDPRNRPLTKLNSQGRPLPIRPGSDDIAPQDDIRWLADIRDVFPQHANLKASSKPSANPVGNEVAAMVELPGGILKSKFPCSTVQPMTFDGFLQQTPLGLQARVFATEFFIEMDYPDDTKFVTLRLLPLRDVPITGPEGNVLTFKWDNRTEIDVRMGNDTEPEVNALKSFKRCDFRTREDGVGEPKLIPRDSDFDLHYEVLDIPVGLGRPVPHTGDQQTQFNGCDPAATGGGG